MLAMAPQHRHDSHQLLPPNNLELRSDLWAYPRLCTSVHKRVRGGTPRQRLKTDHPSQIRGGPSKSFNRQPSKPNDGSVAIGGARSHHCSSVLGLISQAAATSLILSG